MVERQISNLEDIGSIPFARSSFSNHESLHAPSDLDHRNGTPSNGKLMTLETVEAIIQPEADQNGITDPVILVADQDEVFGLLEEETPQIPPFRLIVGMEYILASKLRMKVLHEIRGQFIGLVTLPDARPVTQWYLADGTAERDLDKFPEQDAFDVVRIYRAPDVIYLLRDNVTKEYRSNNAIFTHDKAVELALQHKYEIVTFKEVQDD